MVGSDVKLSSITAKVYNDGGKEIVDSKVDN